MGFVAPLNSGSVIVAGYGFCSAISDGVEKQLIQQGGFESIATDGAAALVASPGIVYAVDENGILSSLKTKDPGSRIRVACYKGRLLAFSAKAGVFEYANHQFLRVNDLPWAEGKSVTLSTAANTAVALTTSGFYASIGGEPFHQVLSEVSPELMKKGLVGAYYSGSQLVIGSYFEGLAGYDGTGKKLWTLGTDNFRGSIFFLRAVEDGIMAGSSSGIYIIPDPSRYTTVHLPIGDIHSVQPVGHDYVISLGDKIYSLDGLQTAAPEGSFAWLPFRGSHIRAGLGYVDPGAGPRISLPDRGFPQVAVLDESFAIVHGRKLGIYSNGEFRDVSTPVEVNSIAALEGEFLLGTSNGVYMMSADGDISLRFASGKCTVRPVSNGSAIACDDAGHVYSASGDELLNFPFSELRSAVQWNDKIVILGKISSGASVILERAANGNVRALDLPVESPVGLALSGPDLCVVSLGSILKVNDPLPLRFPDVVPTVTTATGAKTLRLSNAEDTVTLEIPPARLGPWASPSYQYRVSETKWVSLLPGALLPISRLHSGRSKIEVQSSLGGETRTFGFEVVREYPFWLRWPAWIVYSLAFATFVWAIITWRTRHLALEQTRLQGLVDEKTAELKRSQAMREEFFSSLSHEIRNPLNGVVGLCDILADAPPGMVGPREKRLVNTLKGCAGQLRSMLDDVLDFARIDRGDIVLQPEIFDLVGAVDGSVRSVDASLSNSDVILPHDPIWVSGDCGKLRQVVINLVSNGLKYGVPSQVRVTMTGKILLEGKVAATISVANQGETIPPEEIEKLFGGFVRGASAIKRGIPGHGLGLAVSQRIAIAMGGSLSAQSHEGLTIFTLNVVLPIADAPMTVAKTVHKQRLSRALAIEDETYNRMVLGHMLEQLGYMVDWAVDGESAMERLRTESYDLVLTDYLLPDITGAELTKKILAEASEPKPPVIAVTAYTSSEKISELKRAGVAQVVSKPISMEKLQLAIQGLPVGSSSWVEDFVPPPGVEYNFAQLLRSGGPAVLAKFGDDLQRSWAGVLDEIRNSPERAAGAVHAFRSKILIVEAFEVASLVSDLESAIRLANISEMSQLVVQITPKVELLASHAHEEASSR